MAVWHVWYKLSWCLFRWMDGMIALWPVPYFCRPSLQFDAFHIDSIKESVVTCLICYVWWQISHMYHFHFPSCCTLAVYSSQTQQHKTALLHSPCATVADFTSSAWYLAAFRTCIFERLGWRRIHDDIHILRPKRCVSDAVVPGRFSRWGLISSPTRRLVF